ncbi:hypothetical protein RJT34_05443 [Clitoria ternatea]|uniref:Uncharacterized protein n=1 Tax=Clitoria ternatea TaxID=43366 RepID=A0AAN9K1F5_CLITE
MPTPGKNTRNDKVDGDQDKVVDKDFENGNGHVMEEDNDDTNDATSIRFRNNGEEVMRDVVNESDEGGCSLHSKNNEERDGDQDQPKYET